MPELSHNGVQYHLEERDSELYGFGVDVFMLEKDGARPKEPIAFIPGRDLDSASMLTQQWLKLAFPKEMPGKRKGK